MLTVYDLPVYQVSSGALDMAKTNLEAMLKLCAKPIPPEDQTEELLTTQRKSLHDITHELVRQVTSPNTLVREQVWLGVGGISCI